ncbi:MAG TPA: hypothetical protein VJB37_02200 [Patescibacteria group bacterium]|nr:hypothetical protein [Patescibacteria group bacterium]
MGEKLHIPDDYKFQTSDYPTSPHTGQLNKETSPKEEGFIPIEEIADSDSNPEDIVIALAEENELSPEDQKDIQTMSEEQIAELNADTEAARRQRRLDEQAAGWRPPNQKRGEEIRNIRTSNYRQERRREKITL